MDAERLVTISRRELAESREALDIMAAAWQAQCLAQAIGNHLALCGPPELRGEARGLSEAGGGRGGDLTDPDDPARRTRARAAQFTEISDLRGTLLALSTLLGEVGIALVGVACATDEEGLYWQCIEAIDAADESSDHVRVMLRRLTVRDRARPPGTASGGAPRAQTNDGQRHLDEPRHDESAARERAADEAPHPHARRTDRTDPQRIDAERERAHRERIGRARTDPQWPQRGRADREPVGVERIGAEQVDVADPADSAAGP